MFFQKKAVAQPYFQYRRSFFTFEKACPTQIPAFPRTGAKREKWFLSQKGARQPPQTCLLVLKLCGLVVLTSWPSSESLSTKAWVSVEKIWFFDFDQILCLLVILICKGKSFHLKEFSTKWSSHASKNRDLNCSYSIKSFRTFFSERTRLSYSRKKFTTSSNNYFVSLTADLLKCPRFVTIIKDFCRFPSFWTFKGTRSVSSFKKSDTPLQGGWMVFGS